MSTFKQLLAVAAVIMSPLAMALPASATDADCTITNTGPGSINTCTVNDKYTCEVDDDNNITVKDENNQVAGSGTATSDGNTTGGNATSGSATNNNGTTFTVVIENDGCVVTNVAVPEAPKPAAPQPVNGLGAVSGTGAGAVVAAAPRPTVLPNTSGENFALLGLIVAGALAVVAAGARGLTHFQNRR